MPKNLLGYPVKMVKGGMPDNSIVLGEPNYVKLVGRGTIHFSEGQTPKMILPKKIKIKLQGLPKTVSAKKLIKMFL